LIKAAAIIKNAKLAGLYAFFLSQTIKFSTAYIKTDIMPDGAKTKRFLRI
jgi:hypothetical protein